MSSAGGKIRAKNLRNAEAAKAGKTKPRPSYRERQELEKKPAVPQWVVYAIVFLLGGGLLLELARLFFK
ncbi:unnamed protein product [Sympodiomycopsis kandeliae]